MPERIFIFAYDKKNTLSFMYMGYFDGELFHPKEGFCKSIEDLYKYDFIEIYGMDGELSHFPKRYFNNAIALMKDAFTREYQNMQFSLF